MEIKLAIKERNPIFQGAKELRSIIQASVRENLEGIFPKNHQYQVGDYNLIYVATEGFGEQHGGFCKMAQMVILTPEGDIKSGIVRQSVGSYHSTWEFEEATLKEASDLEVVRYAPQLVKNLHSQLDGELTEKEDPKEIERGVNYLVNNKNLYLETLRITDVALKEMGEEKSELFSKNTDESYIELLDQKKAVIDLFINKGKLMAELKDIALNMKASLVEKKFKEIVGEMVEKGIFPIIWKNSESIGWFGSKEFPFSDLSKPYPFRSMDAHRKRTWGVSADGLVVEFEKGSEDNYEQYSCAEHLLKQAPEILGSLILTFAKKFFKRIKS